MRRRVPDGLRAEMEAAVMSEVERVGPSGFVKDVVVRPFLGRGVHVATLYRWVDSCLISGRPAAAATAAIKAKVNAIIAKAPDPAEAATGEVLARIPTAITVADASADPGGISAVIERIARIARNLDALESHARGEDGKVRNSGLLLKVSAAMNRSLESTVRIRDSLRDDEALERRTAMFVEEIRAESPDCARRIAVRLHALERGGGIDSSANVDTSIGQAAAAGAFRADVMRVVTEVTAASPALGEDLQRRVTEAASRWLGSARPA